MAHTDFFPLLANRAVEARFVQFHLSHLVPTWRFMGWCPTGEKSVSSRTAMLSAKTAAAMEPTCGAAEVRAEVSPAWFQVGDGSQKDARHVTDDVRMDDTVRTTVAGHVRRVG